jgi:hypothetical protein
LGRNARRERNMKRHLLVLIVIAILSSCVPAGVAPPKDDHPCPQGQYWSNSAQACEEWPRSE